MEQNGRAGGATKGGKGYLTFEHSMFIPLGCKL